LDQATADISRLFDRSSPSSMPEPGTPLLVYGSGNCGRDVLRILIEEGYPVVAFLDERAAQISAFEGFPCILPESAEARAHAASGLPVLIAVFNFTADTGAIENLLRHVGFLTIVPYYALDARFPDRLSSRYWMASRCFWESHREDLADGLRLWDDDRSREIYLALVELRLTSNLQLLRSPDCLNQYLPCDLPPPREPIRLVDGGAYTGDTLKAFSRFRMEAVAAFEPDHGNFRHLSDWVSSAGSPIYEAALFPCGLGSETRMRSFHAGGGAACALSAKGDTTVQVVSFDDVLPGFAPNFLKLDVEGAEIDALNGAAGTIRKERPRIAACVYHEPGHLWEIPRLLKELLPSHRLHLRYHGFNGFDAVAYAVEP
jgi:FkbM family methyltransferase